MPISKQQLWFLVFAFVFVLMFGLLCCGKTDLDLGMLVVLVLSAGLLLGLSLGVTGILVRLRPSFRPFFAPLNLGLLLLIMLALSGYFYQRIYFPEEFDHVKAYVALAVPALHDYASEHGRYPDSLSQINLALPIPAGLEYERIVNPSFSHIPSSEPSPGKDFYSINFKDALLCSNGQWFVDP